MDAERRVPTASFRRRALTPPPESLVLVASPPSQTILPGECRALTKDFNSFNFDYKANFASTGNLTEGCTFEISSLYMKGTCSSERNNMGSGCGGGSGVPVNDTSCQAVFEDGPNSALHTPPIPTSSFAFDAGSLCTKSDIGYFFVRYNCSGTAADPTLPLPFDVTLTWSTYSTGCGEYAFPSWARYMIGVVMAMVLVALMALCFKRCLTRRPGPSPAAVQLAPPGGAAGGGYYTGSAAYGADGPPSSYAGAWGAAPAGGAPAGYPPAGGYGGGAYGGGGGYGAAGYPPPPQPFQPPPMTTVTLGQPSFPEEGTSPAAGGLPAVGGTPAPAGSGSFYPVPGSGAPPPSATAADLQSKV